MRNLIILATMALTIGAKSTKPEHVATVRSELGDTAAVYVSLTEGRQFLYVFAQDLDGNSSTIAFQSADVDKLILALGKGRRAMRKLK